MTRNCLSLGALVFVLAVPRLSAAATIQVDSTADVLADDGTCSLREAVIAANSDSASGVSTGECPPGAGADVIDLPAGTYPLAIAGSAEDASATGDLDLLDDVEIAGAGAALTTVDGANLDRVFQVHAGVVAEIAGVTIRKGLVTTPLPVRGGGIQNLGTLVLRGAVVSQNFAGEQSSSPSGSGGGIHNGGGGWLVVEDSTVSDNDAENVGGGILNEATLLVRRSTISGNETTRAASLGGGGIYSSSGCAELTNATISQNRVNGFLGSGGGIVTSAPLIVAHSTFSGNQVQREGGALSILGSGATTLQNSILDGHCSVTAATSAGGNVETSTDTCGLADPTDLVAILASELGLGALADNGGPTFTHSISATSAARDAAAADGCLATDQRGIERPDGDVTSDGNCDAGAFEFTEGEANEAIPGPEEGGILGFCNTTTTTTTTTATTSTSSATSTAPSSTTTTSTSPATTTTTDPKGRVEICHKGRKTKRVRAHALERHLGHGDSIGPCRD